MELETKADINQQKPVGNNVEKTHTINLYKTPPFGQLTLEECEDLFRQRLEALTIIEKADLSAGKVSLISNLFRDIKSYVYKANCILSRANDPEQRRLDHLSHMLMRMYCIYNANLWNWFKACENKLLYYRLRDQASSLSASQLEAILESFNFNFERVVGTELSELYKENLIGWNKKVNDREIVDIFKVKFTDALKFIAKRSVSLKGGYAFLTRHEIISVVCDVFDKHLEHELQYGRQHLNIDLHQTKQLLESLTMVYMDHQDRIEEERKKNKMNSQDNDNNSPYRIDMDNLPEMVRSHYPPCMRYMHEALMEDHHLKYQARLYYMTYLRSCGVDMDSAIEFWRKEFTKKIPNEKFEREYKYNIRHLYGKEGIKKAMSCYSCDKIINDNAPGPADKHGCPFRHFDDVHLRQMMAKHGVSEVDIESLVQMNQSKEYKLTCSHYFKFTKGDLPSEPIKNPAHYFYESVRLANRPLPQEPDVDDNGQQVIADQTNQVISGDMVKEEEDKWDDEMEE